MGSDGKWLTSTGRQVVIAILGEGLTSRDGAADVAESELLELQEHSKRAGTALGVEDVRHFGLPDNRFDTVSQLDVIKIVEGLVDDISPRVVYTHHPGDLNVDHLATSRAVLTATRPMAGTPVKDVLSFEVASSTEWAFQKLEQPFRPSVFVDIGGSLDAKLQAMACYETESRAWPHPRSPEALTAIARRWGSVIGCQAAEAFELVRSIR